MFDLKGFFKKDYTIYAPIKGTCIDITEVNDPVFSTKMVGDGIAIIPNDHVVYSPCDGVVSVVFPTYHAIGMSLDDGTEIMIHIGIDTVNLQGKGFVVNCKEKQRVKRGAKLVEFDVSYLEDEGLDFTTIIILTNNCVLYDKNNLGSLVDLESVLLKKVK